MRKSESHFEYPNGSLLYWAGMRDDGQREAIRSIGGDGSVDFIYVEEANAFSEDDLNELLARLRGTAAPWVQILLATNPDAPTHWIYRRLMLGGEASVYKSSAADNPYNAASYLETLDSLTGVLRDRLARGLWTHAEGAVYSTFDTDTHVIEWFDPPREWMRIRAIDFGFVNPFVCQWWAIDGDGRMYLYREIYQSHTLVEDHARHINALTCGVTLDEWVAFTDDDKHRLLEGRAPQLWTDVLNLDDNEIARRLDRVETIAATVADHDAEDRATLKKYGIHTLAAKKDVQLGLEAVQARLRVQADGKPRLVVMRGATVDLDWRLDKLPQSTLEEFPTYVWEPVREGRAAKEQPVKLHDHGLDATRYAVMYVDNPVKVEQQDDNPFYT
jgi:phage terminase large subunit